MSTEAWPFLISRNKEIDYTVVEAPSFVIQSDVSKHLVDITRGDPTESGKALLRTVRDENGEELTLVFRIARAHLDGQKLVDGYNRPILWVIGLFLKGSARNILVTDEDFQKVQESVIEDYRNFWGHTGYLPTIPSNVLDLPLDGSTGKPFDVVEKEPYVVIPTPTVVSARRTISQVNLELVDDKHFLEDVKKTIFSPEGDAFAALAERGFAFFQLREPSSFEKRFGPHIPLRPYDRYSALSIDPKGEFVALAVYRHGHTEWETQPPCGVYLWDCATLGGRQSRILAVDHEVSAVAFSLDSRYVVCGADNGDIYLYDRHKLRPSEHKALHSGEITAVTFSPDGRTFACSDVHANVAVRELSSSAWRRPALDSKQRFNTHSKFVRAVTFSPDGKLLATQSDDTVKVYDTSNYVEQWALVPQEQRSFTSVAFSADSQTLITSGEKSVQFWNIAEQQEVLADGQIRERRSYVTSLDISPNGEFLLCGFKDGYINVYTLHLQS